MEKLNMKKLSSLLFALISIIWLIGCTDEAVVESQENLTSKQAMAKLADNDESLNSFEPNYNEDEAMSYVLGKSNIEIFPIKVGSKMTVVSKNLDIQIYGDSAVGTLTKTYSGTLFIAASFDPLKLEVDSVFKKVYSTTITRRIIFTKIGNTKLEIDNWKIAAISLPVGGTLNSNVNITKLSLTLGNGDTLEITNPTEYFLYRNPGKFKMLPNINKGEATSVRVEIKSAYADTDFVSMTFGADKKGLYRTKRIFTLVSQTFDGQFYTRVYEQSFVTHNWVGHFHTIITAMPKQVVVDNSTAVECSTWGMPYFVR
ncbi:MAG: hypothetical protein C4539_10750 [Ignavibacteriales bacterium]|nr:MAG: hypothetical protein C4539_10750 [Ignavibacteriales bacterium]